MTTPSRFLSYGRQNIDEQDIAAVVAVLRGDALTQGPAVRAFETALKDKVGAAYSCVCNSGTAALHMSAMAMGLGPGDVVIVPAITFAATANAVRFTGADVVFADCDPQTGLMGVSDVAEALNRVPVGKTVRAVFCVHLNGQCADMPSLFQLCQDRGLYLLEDACHAIGTVYADGSYVGSCRYSDATVFSFHPVKTIAMGEGGAVTTRHASWASAMALYVTHGITKDAAGYERQDMAAAPWYHEMQVLGYNYRSCDINCALALSQLSKLDFFAAERKRLMALYRQGFAACGPVLVPVPQTSYSDPVLHLNAVRIDYAAAGIDRAALMAWLKDQQIGTQVHYIPVYQHPYYRHLYPDHPALPGAESYYRAVLSLPLFVGMTDADVAYVVACLTKVLFEERTVSHVARA